MSLINTILSWYFRKRLPQIEHFMTNPAEVQEDIRKKLVQTAADTEWGKQYDYKSIKTAEEFRNRVPVRTYEEYSSYIERMMKGEQNILWPTEVKWFAKSSGTTNDKSKFIPITFESLDECHYKGGRDVLTIFCNDHPETNIFDGKGLVLGGSHQISKFNSESYYGDLSAVMMQNLPFWVHFLRTPDLSIALMDNWEEKVEQMTQATVNENVTNIAGVPTWTLVLIHKLFEASGKNDLTEIWPNLELYIHGGVSFTPYREQFKQLISSPNMNYLETYNASEGFFGIQDNAHTEDLLLMLDYGIYYEFIPMSEFGSDSAKALSIGEIELGVNYAVVISTNCGLWRYLVGDTVKFTSTRPYKFKITGRTKHYINAFGEELVIENAESALAVACSEAQASIREYTAAPIYFSQSKEAGHEWLIEFDQKPENLEQFTKALDEALQSVNSDYEAKRQKDIALKCPKVHHVPEGTFHQWLKEKGKLGGQHKVPRLSNDREVIDQILSLSKRGMTANASG